MLLNDTISAIATPIGEAGIAVVRISGNQALEIAARIFDPVSRKLSEMGASGFQANRAYFGRISDNGEIIDEVVMTVFRAPRSFTCEDTVEISCHGGVAVVKRILTATLQNGARPADPGEFTKRAFLNGRIDLTQAEAVADLISSSSESARQAAMKQLGGSLRRAIEDLRSQLLDCQAHIEASIDFSEEGLDADGISRIGSRVVSITQSLQNILSTVTECKTVREGVKVAIVGAPNVGKSSLLNALIGKPRAIVSPTPGTTRDTVEELVSIRGSAFRLIDTAGIRIAENEIEAEGINRSQQALAETDIALVVLDASQRVSSAELKLAEHLTHCRRIVALNKIDLSPSEQMASNLEDLGFIRVSAITGMGVDQLRLALWRESNRMGSSNRVPDFLINTRHEDALKRGLEHLDEVALCLTNSQPLDLISSELRLGTSALGEIIGATASDDILDRVFSTFCIGK